MRLKSVRENANMTQEELAISAKVSVSMIQSLESGRRNGSIEMLARLARSLDVSTDELIFGHNVTISTKQLPTT